LPNSLSYSPSTGVILGKTYIPGYHRLLVSLSSYGSSTDLFFLNLGVQYNTTLTSPYSNLVSKMENEIKYFDKTLINNNGQIYLSPPDPILPSNGYSNLSIFVDYDGKPSIPKSPGHYIATMVSYLENIFFLKVFSIYIKECPSLITEDYKSPKIIRLNENVKELKQDNNTLFSSLSNSCDAGVVDLSKPIKTTRYSRSPIYIKNKKIIYTPPSGNYEKSKNILGDIVLPSFDHITAGRGETYPLFSFEAGSSYYNSVNFVNRYNSLCPVSVYLFDINKNIGYKDFFIQFCLTNPRTKAAYNYPTYYYFSTHYNDQITNFSFYIGGLFWTPNIDHVFSSTEQLGGKIGWYSDNTRSAIISTTTCSK
jgi:hypothetical protein